MRAEKLKKILKEHNDWLKADLQGADLKEADLREADLREADLQWTDFREADLRKADLREAELQWANLQGADLREADLQGANLQGTDLREARLQGADLREADLDYGSWPLWCGGLSVDVDDRIGVQLLYHAVQNILCSKHTSDELKRSVSAVVNTANKFHRLKECGKLHAWKEANHEEKA